MSKSKHYRPDEKRIPRVKPSQDNTTKYKHRIFNITPDEEDELFEEVEQQESDEK